MQKATKSEKMVFHHIWIIVQVFVDKPQGVGSTFKPRRL
jgi:hypothetical protein